MLYVSLLQVTPADRRPPEKEETWTLATDQQDPCAYLDDTAESKAKGAHDSEKISQSKPPAEVISADAGGDNAADNNLPRSQETRKSKTKKVKNYLRKCKGALSKGDENATEKRRQENCTSWYLEDVPTCASSHRQDRDESAERYTEFPEERTLERTRDAEPVEDTASEALDESAARTENREATPDEALARLLAEDRKADLNRSRTSVYEDARESSLERCVRSEDKTPIEESDRFRDNGRKDAISLETLTTEDTGLNKCDSSDTLIAEAPEATGNAPANIESESTSAEAEEAESAPKEPADVDEDSTLPVPASCGVSLSFQMSTVLSRKTARLGIIILQ